jgi:hypothetical protein
MLRPTKYDPRLIGLCAVLLGGTAYFLYFTNRFYPVKDWLFWRYAGYWLAVGFWAVSCLSAGYALLGKFFGGVLRKTEQLALGFALGVLAFGLAVFLLGLLHALHWLAFFLLPLAFLAAGWRSLARDLPRLLARVKKTRAFEFDAWTLLVVAAGTIGLGVLYFQMLSPEVFSYDTRWYHMPIAQRYALTGAVTRFEEGFWQAAFPHLASYLFAWAFLSPWTILFDRIEICAHIEFVLFVATLATIPVLLRRLLPRERVGLTWVAPLAFPELYLYDGNLHCDADHIAGFFALPIAMTFFRAWRHETPRNVALFATMASAAALVKYTALAIAVPFALALFLRSVFRCARTRSRAEFATLGTLVGVVLLVTSPHWLKNWIWYGGPAYPVLGKYFALHPWNPEVPARMEHLNATMAAGPFDAGGLLAALKATVTFSFVPNDWWEFHSDVPVFGSLFTLLTPCLFFLRGGRRLAWLVAGAMFGIFMWYLINRYDRYLQAILPWMAAATAGSVVLIWNVGRYARAALVPLLGAQVVWGSDVPFFRTHNLIADSPIRFVAGFVPSGFEQVPNRFDLYEPLTTIGRAIPKKSVVLAHDIIMILGINRNWVSDEHQSRISYSKLRSPRAIHDELRALGVTHLVFPPYSLERDNLAGDLAFMNYAMRATEDQKMIAEFGVVRLPLRPPTDARSDYRVALLGCDKPYATGWYRLSQLTVPSGLPTPPPAPVGALAPGDPAIEGADFVVVDESCHPGVAPSRTFQAASLRGTSRLYVPTARAP